MENKQEQRVREEIARLDWIDSIGSDKGWETSHSFIHKTGVTYAMADQILAIKGLRIEADDQSLPIPEYMFLDGHSDTHYITQNAFASKVSEDTQQKMLKPDKDGCVWVKVIPKEAKDERP